MNDEEIKEIEDLLKRVPPSPWNYCNGDDFDHWEIWSSDPLEGYNMVQGDDGVPPDENFIEFVLKSRGIIEKLLSEVKNSRK
jgi:hypothetical protein